MAGKGICSLTDGNKDLNSLTIGNNLIYLTNGNKDLISLIKVNDA